MELGGGVLFTETAQASIKAETINDGTQTSQIQYSDGATQYVNYGNRLYKITYSNINAWNDAGNVAYTNSLYFCFGGSATKPYLLLSNLNANFYTSVARTDWAYAEDITALKPGESITLWITKKRSCVANNPAVTIECLAVDDPTWTWSETISSQTLKPTATATFTATKYPNVYTEVTTTGTAKGDSYVSKENGKVVQDWTASVTMNGQSYTNDHYYIYLDPDLYISQANLSGINNVSSVSVRANGGTAITLTSSTNYAIANDGNLYITLPSGIAKGDLEVTLNGNKCYYATLKTFFSITELKPYQAVTGFSGIPTGLSANTTTTLAATCDGNPTFSQTISYTIADAGTTGAELAGNKLTVKGGRYPQTGGYGKGLL